MNEAFKLDNPVWYSLSETHQAFAMYEGNIKFYYHDFCPFGGFEKIENTQHNIIEYSKIANNFFIVGERPSVPQPLQVVKELVCLQMACLNPITTEYKEKIVQLCPADAQTLYSLVNLVQPGYFKQKTFHLGKYFGIYKNNELVAVTGERMKMNAYTEVSAVVTHPDHIGNGYAKELVAHTVNTIFTENRMAYLHVAETNTAAINLYKKLGFETRRKISFWNIISGK
ncbi:GNAT family N-acetyltransferase [Parasediminibacterium sp. JCM 36343]|uniref:GNAT family N-acetyltransferase n=1 Tax=Parasediminibacterium sp. JCM 36343 TaxID=3374279 RepID=UPI00397AB5EE